MESFKIEMKLNMLLMRTCGLPDRTSRDWFCYINNSESHVYKLRLDFIKSSFFEFYSR